MKYYLTEAGRKLIEKSALPRVVTTKGKDSPYDDETEVEGRGFSTSDPEHVESMEQRRKELATHLRKIRQGKAKPQQKLHTDPEFAHHRNAPPRDPHEWDAPDEVPDREGPRGSGRRTHAQAAGDIRSEIMNSRGRDAEDHRRDVEKAVSAREKQADASRVLRILRPAKPPSPARRVIGKNVPTKKK